MRGLSNDNLNSSGSLPGIEPLVLIELKQSKSEPQGLVPADDVLFFTIKLKIVSTKSPFYMSVLGRRSLPSYTQQINGRPVGQNHAKWPEPDY